MCIIKDIQNQDPIMLFFSLVVKKKSSLEISTPPPNFLLRKNPCLPSSLIGPRLWSNKKGLFYEKEVKMPEGYPTYFNRGALVMHTVGKMTNNALFLGIFTSQNLRRRQTLHSQLLCKITYSCDFASICGSFINHMDKFLSIFDPPSPSNVHVA